MTDDEREPRDHDFAREKWEEDHCPECRQLVEKCICDPINEEEE